VHADSIAGESARLIAELATAGLPTSCFFEWGNAVPYGNRSPRTVLTGVMGLRQAVTYSLDHLSRNTLYHFRVVASDTASTTSSPDYTFFTTDASLTTLPADSVTTTSALLRVRCNPNGTALRLFFSYGVDSLIHELRTTTVILSESTATTDISLRVTDLTPETKYFFKPQARIALDTFVRVSGRTGNLTTQADGYSRGFVIPLELKDHSGSTISGPRLFGVHSHATYCKDIALGEHEVPPYPPAGSPEIRFVDLHGVSDCMGLGLYWDLRHYFGQTQVDTYMVHIQPDISGYPLILSWGDLRGQYAGQVRLTDLFGGIVVNTNMKSQNSDTISMGIDQLQIVAEGPMNLLASKVDTISGTTAILSGEFNPNGVPTYGWFEWGDTTDYEELTPATYIGSGNETVQFSHRIAGLTPSARYHFRVVAQSGSGNYCGTDNTFTTSSATDVKEVHSSSISLDLECHPNPFNPSITVSFVIRHRSLVTLKVYNILGQKIETLVEEQLAPGKRTVRFDGSRFGSGIYFCVLTEGGRHITRKMVLMR